jgi:hypothetical protein
LKTGTSGNIIWNSYKSINKILGVFSFWFLLKRQCNVMNAIVSLLLH